MELTIEQALLQGIAAHKEGKLQDAERFYWAILQSSPGHPDANHNLGLLAVSANKAKAALPLFRIALEANPRIEQFWLSYIDALIKEKQFYNANQVLKQAKNQGMAGEKLSILETQLMATAGVNEPVLATQKKKLTLSEKRKKTAESKKNKKAKKQSLKVITPSEAEIKSLLEFYQNGQHPDVEKFAESLTKRFPTYQYPWRVLGIALQQTGSVIESLVAMQKSVQLAPRDAEAHNNLGITLKKLGKLDEAELSLTKAIALKPDYAEGHYNLGNTLTELGRLDEAEVSYNQAIALKPDFVEAYRNRGNALKDLGRLEKAVADHAKAIELNPFNTNAYSNFLMTLNYDTKLNVIDRFAAARKFGDIATEKAKNHVATYKYLPVSDKLRVGFVSGDLRNHPVGYFVEGVFSSIDSSKIELFAYPTTPIADDISERLKAFITNWKPIYNQNDEAAANMIVGDGIHILIDLSGHTAGNRLPVFAFKPAPVQVSWLGYFATTGMSEMDYVLGDPYVTPEEFDEHFIEKIWRLPETRLCFTPPKFDIEISALPALNNGYVTFGCLNPLYKLNEKVLRLWAKVLAAIPKSQLLLKNRQLSEPLIRETIKQRFTALGIDSTRINLEGPEDRKSFLSTYNRIDIALDPFPIAGGATSAESLWMGVPLLTLAGNTLLFRQGVGILMNAGLPNWVASNEEEYMAKAIHFASDHEELAKLRDGLRSQILASPFFDAPRFAQNFENALLEMWNQTNK